MVADYLEHVLLERCACADIRELGAVVEGPLGFVVVVQHDNLLGYLDEPWELGAVGPADSFGRSMFFLMVQSANQSLGVVALVVPDSASFPPEAAMQPPLGSPMFASSRLWGEVLMSEVEPGVFSRCRKSLGSKRAIPMSRASVLALQRKTKSGTRDGCLFLVPMHVGSSEAGRVC